MPSLKPNRKSFPYPTSAWWIPVLLGIGWLPFFGADAAATLWPYLDSHEGVVAFMMAWFFDIAIPCSILATVSVAVQIIRLTLWEMRQ